MRKVNILAIATTLLAVVTVVTGLIRGDVAADNRGKLSAVPAAEHVLTAGGLQDCPHVADGMRDEAAIVLMVAESHVRDR